MESGLVSLHHEETIDDLRTELAVARTRIAELEAALGSDFMAPSCFCLTRTEERLVGLLMSFPRVSRQQAAAALYEDERRQKIRPEFTIQRFMQNVRVKLKLHKIIVNNVYGAGWAIPVRDKERIYAMIATDPLGSIPFKQKAAE